MSDECDGPARVIEELAKSPDAGFEPEPAPVRHLRAYSNYLSPKLGALSADAWTLAATVVRNILLNWIVLIPLFAAVLLLPVLSWRILWLKPMEIHPANNWFLIVSALLLGAFATAYVGYDLPNAGNARRPYGTFLWAFLIPLAISAVHLSTFWAWLPVGGHGGAWWDVVSLGKRGLTWWHFGLFGALMHGGGMLAGILYVSIRFDRPPRTTGLAATAAAVIAGFAGGIAGLYATALAPAGPTGALLYPKLYAALGVPAVIGIFLLSGTLLVGATSYVTEDEDREWWARSGGWLLAVGLGWLSFSFLVLYAAHSLNWLNMQISTAFTAITAITGWAAAAVGSSSATPSGRRDGNVDVSKMTSSGLMKEYGSRLLLPAFLALLAMLLAGVNLGIVKWIGHLPNLVPSCWPAMVRPMGQITAHPLWLIVAYVAVCLLASWFIDVNKFSLHGMYRLRLIRAYLGASNVSRNPHKFTGFDENDNIAMCCLTSHRPLHVVNIALNLVGGANLAWQQRKAESFTATRLHAGSCRVGYRSSALYGGRYKEDSKKNPITLGTAFTISGAAASPNMGYHSSPLLTLIMTLFNARLGWWLGNPREPGKVWKRPGPRWGIRSFLDEAFGLTTDKNAWLYLSDGGHFENLGIYEMVLRRCALIVVSDAGADPGYSYEDLANAVRKIRIDLGIPIEFDKPSMPMSPLHEPNARFGGQHCAIGRILYGAVDKGAKPGMLIYIKASLNGNEPPDVKQYAVCNTTFPHQTTSDQFFDEEQFESYRRLGLHMIEEICGVAPGLTPQMNLSEFTQRAEQYCGAQALKPAEPTLVSALDR
jgi:hypothetical protein